MPECHPAAFSITIDNHESVLKEKNDSEQIIFFKNTPVNASIQLFHNWKSHLRKIRDTSQYTGSEMDIFV